MKIFIAVLLGILIICIIQLIVNKYKIRVIHNKIVRNNICIAKHFITRVENTNSLDELYCIFREITKSLDVSFILDPYGIFRAKSLESCQSTDIYLGDINGLWTLTLNKWMQTDDIEAVKEVTYQFKNALINTLSTYIYIKQHEKSK